MGYGTPDESTGSNPIVEVNLRATESDNFYFQVNPDEQYIGLYHRHEDGTLMTGIGELELVHDMNPDEIIFRKISYQDIQDTREKVLHKKNKSNKPNKKGYQENVKRDKKNSWNNRSSQL